MPSESHQQALERQCQMLLATIERDPGLQINLLPTRALRQIIRDRRSHAAKSVPGATPITSAFAHSATAASYSLESSQLRTILSLLDPQTELADFVRGLLLKDSEKHETNASRASEESHPLPLVAAASFAQRLRQARMELEWKTHRMKEMQNVVTVP